MRVAELAAAAGVAPDTVRYYERTGLLAPPPRTPGGYRAFPESAVERLRFIQGCQRLGLRLKEIASLLTLRDTGECPCEPAEALLRRRIAEIDAETARLATLRADLVHMVDSATDGPCVGPDPDNWPPPRGGDK
jgi:DNA-binding transcriptional MerR regulator